MAPHRRPAATPPVVLWEVVATLCTMEGHMLRRFDEALTFEARGRAHALLLARDRWPSAVKYRARRVGQQMALDS